MSANKELEDQVIVMWRWRYSPYTIGCTLGLETSAVDRIIYAWEETQKPAGGGGKGRR